MLGLMSVVAAGAARADEPVRTAAATESAGRE